MSIREATSRNDMLVTSIRPGLGGVDDQAGDRRNLDCASGSLAGVI